MLKQENSMSGCDRGPKNNSNKTQRSQEQTWQPLYHYKMPECSIHYTDHPQGCSSTSHEDKT
jgi:hypothetical protein